MKDIIIFLINSVLLGAGLAMDAFSVSLADGFADVNMKKGRMCRIAGTFGLFQMAMPLIGWICVHTIAIYFKRFQMFIPWIALVLLLYIGIKMIIDGLINKTGADEVQNKSMGHGTLLVQGVATSIDALSVGFAIASYTFLAAFAGSAVIGLVTFLICMAGLALGKKIGTRIASKAYLLGGLILIGIGIEIFVSNI
ncbi:MAG: manganese efflux pump MntP family protein [Lachnospiraceae bacterium]|nr:manganese efflux pump MntP family protein [Lachnospiraceae bacterium]